MNTYRNHDTRMESRVVLSGGRYRVTLHDLDSGNTVPVVSFFPTFLAADKHAWDLVFPSGGKILSPVFIPTIR